MDACLALIAHDARRHDLVDFAVRNAARLRRCALVAPDATGRLLESEVGLRVERLPAGQVAARVVMGEVDAVVFLVDALCVPGGEPDLSTLLRVCDMHDVPLASSVVSADLLMGAVSASWLPQGAGAGVVAPGPWEPRGAIIDSPRLRAGKARL